MFDRFSGDARGTLARSVEQARRLGHDFIAPAHVIMALVSDEKDLPARALRNLQLDPKVVSAKIAERVPRGRAQAGKGQLPFTPGSKLLLEAALEEAQTLGHHHIGTEHLFLGALRADDTGFLGEFVAKAFDDTGLKPFEVRAELLRLVAER
jgi:ATP-dependent Clp protease ATP-binding subunit ClpC